MHAPGRQFVNVNAIIILYTAWGKCHQIYNFGAIGTKINDVDDDDRPNGNNDLIYKAPLCMPTDFSGAEGLQGLQRNCLGCDVNRSKVKVI